MIGRPTVAEQEEQPARIFDGITQVRSIQPGVRECPDCCRPACLDIAGELADLLADADTGQRRWSIDTSGTRQPNTKACIANNLITRIVTSTFARRTGSTAIRDTTAERLSISLRKAGNRRHAIRKAGAWPREVHSLPAPSCIT
jgi:hypothetical protein